MRKDFPIVVIQEAGLDGFWIYRVLEQEGIESHVVDPASIMTSRRPRRAKTDRIDGEALVRALLAHQRGEPRVCAMVRVPTPEEEDRRRVSRELKALTAERVRHVNRVKGLLFAQGVSGYEPLRRDRRAQLEQLQTGDGRPLPDHMKRQISRELDRLELLLEQIKAVAAERDVLLVSAAEDTVPAPAKLLLALKGIGPDFASVLWQEGLYRHFDNRRQVAAYAGLAPTPWKSGSVDREHGLGIGLRQDKGGAGAARRTDRAEDTGPIVALIAQRRRPCALFRPDVGQAALLADTCFILPPELDRLAPGLGRDGVSDQCGKVFLCASCAKLSACG